MNICTVFLSTLIVITHSQLPSQHTYIFSQCGDFTFADFLFSTPIQQSINIYISTDCNHPDFQLFRDGYLIRTICGSGYGDNMIRTDTSTYSANLNRKLRVNNYLGAIGEYCCFQVWFTVDYYCTNITNCLNCLDFNTCTQCKTDHFFYNSLCKPCLQIIPNCNTCASNSSCTICDSGFLVNFGLCKTCPQIIPNCNTCASNSSCSSCANNLILHQGKCFECKNLIPNCILCQNSQNCLQCVDPYELDSLKKCRKCKSDLFFVSDLCSKQKFCISAYKDSSNNVVCNFCAFNKNYYIDSNNKCVCGKGYQDNNQVCQEICGDGISFIAECDDNNTYDGDGCSSTCRIQLDFVCSKARSGASKCKLQQNIKFKLQYVNKIMDSNKALMYFSLDTNNPNAKRFYDSDLFNFTLSSNRSKTITILSYSKNQKNQIVIEIQYNQTIEDSGINLNFEFPKDHVISENHQRKFILKGNNFALIISEMYEKYHQVTQIEIYFIAFSYAIVLIFLLSDKFIAVQALCSLQTVYFSLLLIYRNSSWTQALSTVLPLKYSMGFNQLLYQQTEFVNLKDPTFSKFRYLRMCESFLLNNFTNSSILLVLSLVFLVLFFIKNRLENKILISEDANEKKMTRKSLSRIRAFFKKIYNLTFNFSYVMIFEVLVSLYIETAYMKSISPELKVLSKLAGMWSFSTIIFTILDKFKHMFFTNEQALVETFKFGLIESRYKAVYLSYILINALMVCLLNDKLLFGVPSSAILEGLAVLYQCFLIFYRPYQYSFGIHGFTVIFNQAIYIITLTLITAMNYGIIFQEFFLLFFCYILLGFCMSIVLLTFIRVYVDYKHGALMEIEHMRRQIEQARKLQQTQFARQPLKVQHQNDNLQQDKHKRNNYIFENRVRKEQEVQFLNQLKAKKFLSQQQRDCIYYKFYKEKPLQWVQKHQKKVKYQYLLQKNKQDLQKDTYKKYLDKKKQEKAQNKKEIDELNQLKDKLRQQFENKKAQKSRKKSERKAIKNKADELESKMYEHL